MKPIVTDGVGKGDFTPAERERLRGIIAAKSLRTGADGSFRLASGEASAFYFDMKPTLLDPEGANLIARGILAKLEGERLDFIGGLAMGAIPIVAAVSALSWPACSIPGFFVRPQAKERGTQRLIEGNIEPGARVALVEDVSTTGGSALQAVEAVRAIECTVATVISVVDRKAGAADAFAAAGIGFDSLFTRDDFDL